MYANMPYNVYTCIPIMYAYKRYNVYTSHVGKYAIYVHTSHVRLCKYTVYVYTSHVGKYAVQYPSLYVNMPYNVCTSHVCKYALQYVYTVIYANKLYNV